MKKYQNPAILIVLAVIGAARFVDFVRYTNLETGFFTSGSLGLRYALLGLGLLLCASALFSKKPKVSPEAFNGAGLAFVCIEGILCEVLGVFICLQAVLDAFSWFRLCQGIMFVVLGIWCFYASVYAISSHKALKNGSIIAAVGGCALYLTVLERFLESPSSLHRMWPVLDILSIISSILLFTTIFKAVYTKNEERPYRRLAAFGMSTFFLSTCIQAPCAVYLFSKNVMNVNDLAISVLLAFFGLIGAIAAQQAAGE